MAATMPAGMSQVLAALLAFAASGTGGTLVEAGALRARDPSAARVIAAEATRGETGRPAACFYDTCQPVVSVPGFEPRLDLRGRRTELFLAMLDRLDLGPVNDVARFVASTGVRVDYTPERKLRVWLRWRIGPYGEPVSALRR